MNFNYLYYPSIALPDDSWLRKVLLYSESIASIVPRDLKRLSNYNIELLTSENEYRSFSPENFLSNSQHKKAIDNFQNEVKDYFSSDHFKNFIIKDRSRNNSFIYESKFTSEIKNIIKEMNLIEKYGKGWWEASQIFSDTYLGILAKHMGNQYNYVPTTNSIKNQDIAFKNNSLATEKVGELRLIELLPSPAKNVPITEILKFKNKRRQELLKFRTVLRENIKVLNQINNREELVENLQIFKEKIEIEVNHITSLLKENRIHYIFESLKTLVSFDREFIARLAAGTLFSMANGTSVVKGASLGVAAEVAINVGSIIKDYHLQSNNIIRSSPYSYAFYSNNFIKKASNNKLNTLII